MKNFILEFKQFAMRGSVIDLAVGIIIGGAFQKIVSSLVGDIALPAISPILGGVDFTSIKLGPILIGNFLQTTLDFIIIAFFIFLLVKGVNTLKKKEEKVETPNKQELLLTEIRDLLKSKSN
jgi:large conductance mechanosensitive channel